MKALAVLLSFLVFSVSGSAFAQQYTVTDLGTLGGIVTQGFEVNDSGVVAGHSTLEDLTYRAVRFENGALTDLGSQVGEDSGATGINNNGTLAGYTRTANSGTAAVTWDDEGFMNVLGTLGGNWGQAWSINSLGQTVGSSNSSFFGGWQAFYHNGSFMIGLAPLVAGRQCFAREINDSGLICGYAEGNDFTTHAVIWNASDPNTITSITPDIEMMGMAFAFGVNNAGQVVGMIEPPLGPDPEINIEAFVWENGVRTTLGSLGGMFCEAHDINDQGQIVGRSTDATNALRAFLWENGQMVDLNTMIAPGSDWLLQEATSISESGYIAGYGVRDGIPGTRGFLLTPVQGGEPGDLNCDGNIDGLDAQAMTLAILDSAGYDAAYPDCDISNGDINNDTVTNAADIDGFASLLLGE